MAEQDRNGERYRMIYFDSEDGSFYDDEIPVELTSIEIIQITRIIAQLVRTSSNTVHVSDLLTKLLLAYVFEMQDKEKLRNSMNDLVNQLDGSKRTRKYLESLLAESIRNGGKIERAVSPYYYRPTEYEAEDKFYTTEEVQSLSGGTW